MVEPMLKQDWVKLKISYEFSYDSESKAIEKFNEFQSLLIKEDREISNQ